MFKGIKKLCHTKCHKNKDCEIIKHIENIDLNL